MGIETSISQKPATKLPNLQKKWVQRNRFQGITPMRFLRSFCAACLLISSSVCDVQNKNRTGTIFSVDPNETRRRLFGYPCGKRRLYDRPTKQLV